jgi:hypothetical protein
MNELRLLIDEAGEKCKTKVELARILGVDRQRLNDWRSGRVPCPLKQAARIAELAGRPESEGILAVAQRKLARATTLAGVGALVMLSFGAADPAQAAGGCGKATTMYRPVKSRWRLRWIHHNAETALRGRFALGCGVGSRTLGKSRCRAYGGRWRPTPAEQPLTKEKAVRRRQRLREAGGVPGVRPGQPRRRGQPWWGVGARASDTDRTGG